MVGIKSIILLITLGSYLVAFVNAQCKKPYGSPCYIGGPFIDTCCRLGGFPGFHRTSCSLVNGARPVCLARCQNSAKQCDFFKNTLCSKDYSGPAVCLKKCEYTSDCDAQHFVCLAKDGTKLCVPCNTEHKCDDNNMCCPGHICNNGKCKRGCRGEGVLCNTGDETRHECCNHLFCVGSTCQKCLTFNEPCTAESKCCPGYTCKGLDASKGISGFCDWPDNRWELY